MINAKVEIVEHIGERKVELVRVVFGRIYGNDKKIIEGSLEYVLPMLDFNYDDGYGSRHLHGYIWYADGTWSSRGEYDGSEWWEHHSRPPMDIEID